MRTLLKVTCDTEAGNLALKSGRMQQIIEATVDRLKPEAIYFTADGGKRTAFVFFDLQNSNDMPAIAEPFFMELKADVTFTPVMNSDDLKQGLAKAYGK